MDTAAPFAWEEALQCGLACGVKWNRFHLNYRFAEPFALLNQRAQRAVEIASLKSNFVSSDWAIAEPALDELVRQGGDEVLAFLVSFLTGTDVLLRNRAAIALHDLADSRALAPLLQAIFRKENEHHRGTLVWALEPLDCSQLLVPLFDLLFYGNAEVKRGAMSILDSQVFEFDTNDLYAIQAKWEEIQQHPENCPEYEEHREDIQQTVDGYLAYLKD